jgi:hypothetical protein
LRVFVNQVDMNPKNEALEITPNATKRWAIICSIDIIFFTIGNLNLANTFKAHIVEI